MANRDSVRPSGQRLTYTFNERQELIVSNGVEVTRFSPDAGREFLEFQKMKREKGFETPTEPVFDDETAALFREKIASCRFYLEFGSGGSTVAVDQLGIPALSVECDAQYFEVVRGALRPDTKVELILAFLGVTTTWGRPIFHNPTPQRLARWRYYSEAPFPIIKKRGVFPDFVLVDGRFRSACALRAAREAQLVNAPVAILIDDYFDGERPTYRRIEEVLGAPRQIGRSAYYELPPDAGLPIDVIDTLLAIAERDIE